MPSEARLKRNYRKIKGGPQKLNFGASKPGFRGGWGPQGPPGSASGRDDNQAQIQKSLLGAENIRVAMTQRKQGIWFLLFPDRENTWEFCCDTGKHLETQGKYFDCEY